MKAQNGQWSDRGLTSQANDVSKRGQLTHFAWFIVEACIVNNRLMPVSRVRAGLLRLFGARIGSNCRFLHAIRVKSPWNLEVGDNSWFGEDVCIHNRAMVRIGSNVCVSQGTYVASGSPGPDAATDSQADAILIEDGAWITSMCVIQKGVTVGRSAVVTPLSVVHRSLAPDGIYGGNPCRLIRRRFKDETVSV